MQFSRYAEYAEAMASRNGVMLVAAVLAYFVVLSGALLVWRWPGLKRLANIGGVTLFYVSLAAMAYYYFSGLAPR